MSHVCDAYALNEQMAMIEMMKICQQNSCHTLVTLIHVIKRDGNDDGDNDDGDGDGDGDGDCDGVELVMVMAMAMAMVWSW